MSRISLQVDGAFLTFVVLGLGAVGFLAGALLGFLLLWWGGR